MQRFNNILFVSHGVANETEALKQALSLARNNKAELKALIVCPDFPEEMAGYKDKYKASLVEQLEASIQATREAIKVSVTDVPVQIEVESGDTPAIRIICHVLKSAHDLVIKEAKPIDGGKGFMAMDMELLRKCPCPVWLTRPISRHRNEMRVSVAIDPEGTAPEGRDLSIRLLQLASSLATTCGGALDIISCWHFEYEDYLRSSSSNSMWIKISNKELDELVHKRQGESRASLEAMIHQSGIAGKININQLKGIPEAVIPDFVMREKIDILVMGTVARTGIHSFVIGNTAENILQKVGCSLLALKPIGFISPVKAY